MRLSKLICPQPKCQWKNERNANICIKCKFPLGFINVNLLSDPYFRQRLEERYQEIIAEVPMNKVQHFESIIDKEGRAVVNMSYELLRQMVNENKDYVSYQRAVEHGKIIKKNLEEDQFQCVVESSLYGFDGRNFVYAALSLDNQGLSFYGDVSVTLKTSEIEERTTFFERDSFLIYEDFLRKGWIPGTLIPAGHCGIWEERAKIATVKHITQIGESQQIADFAAIISKKSESGTDAEFIELHIFNKINKTDFEKITFRKKSLQTYHQLQFKILKFKLSNLQLEATEI